MQIRLSFLCLGLLTQIACGSSDGSPSTPADCSAEDAPTYETFGKAFLDEYCASCHAASVTGAARMGAPMEDHFDTLAEAQDAKGELLKEVVTEESMPFGPSSPKPSSEERQIFGEWIRCGAP